MKLNGPDSGDSWRSDEFSRPNRQWTFLGQRRRSVDERFTFGLKHRPIHRFLAGIMLYIAIFRTIDIRRPFSFFRPILPKKITFHCLLKRRLSFSWTVYVDPVEPSTFTFDFRFKGWLNPYQLSWQTSKNQTGLFSLYVITLHLESNTLISSSLLSVIPWVAIFGVF